MKFQKGHQLGAKPITEQSCRYAISNSQSNTGAARFLNVNIKTYHKYASRYIDIPSGKNLYELHKNMGHKGIKQIGGGPKGKLKYNLQDILEGKIKNSYTGTNLMKHLFSAGIFPPRCFECGFSERRVTDNKVPIYIDFINGDISDGRLENIRILCHNHYFLYVGNTHGSTTKHYSIEREDISSVADEPNNSPLADHLKLSSV